MARVDRALGSRKVRVRGHGPGHDHPCPSAARRSAFPRRGGHCTSDGHHVGTGLLRGPVELARACDADVAVLETIGIRTVFDPRTHHERTHSRIGYPIDPPTATMRLADGAPSASTKPRTPTVDDFSA